MWLLTGTLKCINLCHNFSGALLTAHLLRGTLHRLHHRALIEIQYKWSKQELQAIWNVMAHAPKPDFVFRRNGLVHLNRRGASVQSTAGSWGVRISGINVGYTMFWGSVKGTGYSLHSTVSPSLPLLRVTVCHNISTGLYQYKAHFTTPTLQLRELATAWEGDLLLFLIYGRH